MREDSLLSRYHDYKGPTWTEICEQYPYHLKISGGTFLPNWLLELSSEKPELFLIYPTFVKFKNEEHYVMAKLSIK